MATDLGIWNFEAALAVLVTRRPDTIPSASRSLLSPGVAPSSGFIFGWSGACWVRGD